MASQTRQFAEQLSEALRSYTKPSITELAYSTEDDFRVMNLRPHLDRLNLSDCTIHTFIVCRDRVPMRTAGRDRCGYRFGFTMEVSMIRKLTSVDATLQPGSQQQLDGCMEYAEWVQDIVGGNLEVAARSLTDMNVLALPEVDIAETGMWMCDMELTYG